MSFVTTSLEESVAVIRFANPPVNGLAHAVRFELAEALSRAATDPAIKAIVLTGGAGLFSGGADIREFGTPLMYAQPTLRQLIEQVENSSKPVIAAIEGICLGGGFELVLATHYRVAAENARFGLPEVKLGLLPGAGGTQRLPRLVGPEKALEMIVGGDPVAAPALAGTALINGLAKGDLLAAALELAGSVSGPVRTSDLTVDRSETAKACEAARQRTKSQPPAPRRAIDSVERSAGPFEEGLRFERDAFLQLMESPESKALRYAFFAERAAGKLPGAADSPVRPVNSAAVIGGGTMGSGIAVCFLNAGIPVSLLEADQPLLDQAVARISAIYDGQMKKGKLSESDRARLMALLRPTLNLEDLRSADIAVEAVFESMDAKRQVFTELDRVLKPGAILASNTSTLDLNKLARFTSRPGDVLGMHFFSPANVMRLLEVVRGERTSTGALATALKLGRTLRKVPVIAGVGDGFIGNRMLEQYTKQANYLLEEGASPESVDRAMENFGMAMGPFRVADLVGNDVSFAIRQRRRAERPDYRYSTLPDRLCQLGRLGQKSGAGWYDYSQGSRQPLASSIVSNLIDQHRRELGIAPRDVSDAEIVDRLVYALVNQGARLLEEGIATQASDIDVVYLTGYGFPAWRGGPMYYADQQGLSQVVQRIREFAANPNGDPSVWTVAPLLDHLAREGKPLLEFSQKLRADS